MKHIDQQCMLLARIADRTAGHCIHDLGISFLQKLADKIGRAHV